MEARSPNAITDAAIAIMLTSDHIERVAATANPSAGTRRSASPAVAPMG
jgi:hypothetical protein